MSCVWTSCVVRHVGSTVSRHPPCIYQFIRSYTKDHSHCFEEVVICSIGFCKTRELHETRQKVPCQPHHLWTLCNLGTALTQRILSAKTRDPFKNSNTQLIHHRLLLKKALVAKGSRRRRSAMALEPLYISTSKRRRAELDGHGGCMVPSGSLHDGGSADCSDTNI